MKISIIGAGNVGSSLGRGLAERGHRIMFGARDPHAGKLHTLLVTINTGTEPGRVRAATVKEAVEYGDLVILAIPPAAVADVCSLVGDWGGKPVLDATNRLTPAPPDSKGSAAQDFAALAANARVVKVFNTIGANLMERPVVAGQAASMFICGDDDDAKQVAGELAAELGFDVVDCGPLDNASLVEALGRLWVTLARGGYGREIAFRLLR